MQGIARCDICDDAGRLGNSFHERKIILTDITRKKKYNYCDNNRGDYVTQ